MTGITTNTNGPGAGSGQRNGGWRQAVVMAARTVAVGAAACVAVLTASLAQADGPRSAGGAANASGASTPSPTRQAQPAAPKPPVRHWIRYPAPAPLSAQAQLGRLIFFDPSLSASGRMSCATCHSPAHAYAPPNGLVVQLGGPHLDRPGTRTVPSLRYLTYTPLFTRHQYLPGPGDSDDEGPAGGFMRDGLSATLHEQPARPLLDPNEMANPSRAAVVDKVRRGAYAGTFRQVFGAQIFADTNRAFDSIGLALAAFETEDPSFHPYTSKFDAVMSGNADFTPQELRGYVLFKSPLKGNCARCHLDQPGPGGRPAQFTDFQYSALGVPRNPEIPANRNPKYFDMGLCGPIRKDLAKETDFCGMFKDPTLRNAASRPVFFHNGRFRTLEDVVRFYMQRDTQPKKWYPVKNGKVVLYDDLPPALRKNVNIMDPPFFNRRPGQKPALDESEIRDLVAFLKTLDDGYSATAGGPAIGAGATGATGARGR